MISHSEDQGNVLPTLFEAASDTACILMYGILFLLQCGAVVIESQFSLSKSGCAL